MKTLLLMAVSTSLIVSHRAPEDFALTADPGAAAWKNVPAVFAANGPRGEKHPGAPTEIRSRWTARNLYFLFVCPYETLYLKPDPHPEKETWGLWEYDVAEVFIAPDPGHVRRYKEFEVSPQQEWIDLDVDRDRRGKEVDWLWNSGFEAKTRIDRERKVWYCEMRIPLDKIGAPPPRPGLEMRINLYRIEGGPPNRKYIAWQPTQSASFHVPEAFGRVRLE